MTIEIRELVIRAEVHDAPVARASTELSRDAIEKLVARVTEQVLRELRYRQEKHL